MAEQDFINENETKGMDDFPLQQGLTIEYAEIEDENPYREIVTYKLLKGFDRESGNG